VESLDFSTLERVNASFVSDNLKRSEGDMVWKVRRRDGTPVYVYLLVEFQSRADRFMAVRIMASVAALYLDLIARGELAPGRKLPLVIPLIAYSIRRPRRTFRGCGIGSSTRAPIPPRSWSGARAWRRCCSG
jgi:predicted transposase YdaD